MEFKAILVFTVAIAVSASEPAMGRWEGIVQIPGSDLRLVIDLTQDGAGHWIGSAIVPGFGIKGAPLTNITIQDSAVSFAIKGALGQPKLKGRLTASGTFTGDYLQAGNTAPFTLHKAGPPQVDPPRQSTLISNEFEGEWKGVMDLFGYPIHVQLKVANQGGKASAQFHMVGKRDSTVPLDVVIEENNNLTLESSEAGVSYEGRLRNETGEITGTYHQGPLEAPLNLTRTKRATGARP